MRNSEGNVSPIGSCDNSFTDLDWVENAVPIPTTEETTTPETTTEFTDHDCHWIPGSWGAVLTCPEGYALSGICGSGGNADCGGYYHKIQCCEFAKNFRFKNTKNAKNSEKCQKHQKVPKNT